MKNLKPLISCILLICCSISQAQTRLAVKGGFNYSTARAYYNSVKQSTGYVAGANFRIQAETIFEGRLYFTPSISYNSRGYVIRADSNRNDENRSIIHYGSIAPLLSFHFGDPGKSLFLTAGPILGVAISGREKIKVNNITATSKMKFTTTSEYGLFDLGLYGALGYKIKAISVEAGYYFGFASINNNEELDKRNIRNRSFNITLGYYFKTYK
ncbi:MAG: porin family protein [Ferruginibacter sp.]